MKQFITTLAIICIALTAQAQEKTFTGSLLWKVSGKDITKPSYILATHHLVDTTFLQQINGYQEAYSQAEVIIGELDLKDRTDLIAQSQAAITIQEGEKTYTDILSTQEIEALNKKMMEVTGIPFTAFIQMKVKPMAVSLMISLQAHKMAQPEFDVETHKSIDEYVQNVAASSWQKSIGTRNC